MRFALAAPQERRAPRWVALLTAVLLAAAGGALAASPAHAATGDPDDPNYLGELIVNPTSGSATALPAFEDLTTTSGLPTGYQKASRTLLYFPGGPRGDIQALIGVRTTGDPMLTAPTIHLSGSQTTSGTLASRWSWDSIPVGGTFKILVTGVGGLYGGGIGANTPLGEEPEKYFVANLVKTSNTTWEVAGGSTEPPAKTATSFTDVAVTAKTATSATLSATISPADATGDVTFTSGDKTVKGTLSGGVATAAVSGLTPGTEYTFTASYAENTTHLGTSKDVTFTTGSAADSAESGIGVEIPEETSTDPSGLKISVKPTGVSLSGAATREKDAAWEATGSLGDVTVNDDRRDAAAEWTLNGEASPFAAAEKPALAASNLGWAPSKLDGAGTAGATIAPGADGGLSQPKVLAFGVGAATPNVTTKVTAGLTLKVPAGTASGNYTSTLTLTLI